MKEHGGARTKGGDLVRVQCAHAWARHRQTHGARRRIHRGTDGDTRLMERSS